MFTPDNSAMTRCMIGALKQELNTHEFRGPLRAIAIASSDITEIEELVRPTISNSKDKPNIFLIWLPSDDKLPQWATSLYQRLKKYAPDAYFVWIVWLPGMPIPTGAEIFQQPTDGSFVLNIDQPKGWPEQVGSSYEARAAHLIEILNGNPENHFQALSEWLKILIG